jgi:hypothetical protein
MGVFFVLFLSGCKQDMKFIDHVTFKPADNLETVRISLVFTDKIKSDLAGGYPVKDYGFLFINPYTPTQPFEVGFDLNTAIVNDQDYIKLTPTEVLPNGLPIGLPNAIVQIQAPHEISPQFDLYGYVDVLHASWLGVAPIFTFLSDKYFPAGISVSQVFMRDDQGRPGILAAIFGPTLNDDGSLKRAGGIAVFANVRQLLAHHSLVKGQTENFYPEPGVTISGPASAEYEGRPDKMFLLQRKLIRAFNRN